MLGFTAAAVPPAAVADRAWREPVLVPTPDHRMVVPVYSASAAGEITLATTTTSTQQVLVKKRGEVFGEIQDLGPSAEEKPVLASNGRGETLLVWGQPGWRSRIVVSARTGDGKFSPPREVAPYGESPKADVNRLGIGVIGYDDTGRPRVRLHDPLTGLLSPPERIVPPERGGDVADYYLQDVAIADDGTVVALVATPSDPYRWAPREFKVTIRPPGGTFGEPQLVATAGSRDGAKLGLDALGRGMILWTLESTRQPSVYLTFLDRDGTLSDPQLIGQMSGRENFDLVVSDVGKALVSFEQDDPTVLRASTAEGRADAPFDKSEFGRWPELAVNTSGAGAVAYTEEDTNHLTVKRGPPPTAPGPSEHILGEVPDLTPPGKILRGLMLDSAGNATVLWEDEDYRLLVSEDYEVDPAPPDPDPLPAPPDPDPLPEADPPTPSDEHPSPGVHDAPAGPAPGSPVEQPETPVGPAILVGASPGEPAPSRTVAPGLPGDFIESQPLRIFVSALPALSIRKGRTIGVSCSAACRAGLTLRIGGKVVWQRARIEVRPGMPRVVKLHLAKEMRNRAAARLRTPSARAAVLVVRASTETGAAATARVPLRIVR